MSGRPFSLGTLAPWVLAAFREARGIRFLIMGAVNALFGFLVFSLAIWLGAESWLALLISNVVGIGWNFLTMGGVVFRELAAARLPRFVLVYLGVYLVNLAGIHMICTHVDTSKIIAQALLVLPMALMSYLLLGRYVFRREL